MNKYLERLYNGVIKENPTLVLMLGMCPTLAVSLSEFSNSYLHNFLAGAFRYYYILGNQQKNVAALFYDK